MPGSGERIRGTVTRYYCNDVVEAMGWPHYHCDSCHEDLNEHGLDLAEEDDGGDVVGMCCDVMREAQPVMAEVWKKLRAARRVDPLPKRSSCACCKITR